MRVNLKCAAVLVAASCVAAAPAVASARDLAAHPESLAKVPGGARPEFRWWWPTDTLDANELREELRAIKRAGFGAVEQSLFANVRRWGTPAFREGTRVALGEANRLGLRYDITLGPGWPVSSPGVEDLAKEASVQALHYGVVDVNGPATYSGSVPDRPPPGGARRRLVAVTAMRVAGAALDPASGIDLTGRVRADGTLTWSAPTGRWKLFGFWMRPSLMRAKSGDGSQGWLVVDHFSRRAIDVVLRDFDRMLFGGDLAASLRRNGGDVFEDSYEVDYGAVAPGQTAVFWTGDMADQFAHRRGYGLTQLLPGLFEEFAFPGGIETRLKHDFDRTLNDLLVEQHLGPIRRWANRKGLRSRSQAYQAGLGQVGTTENGRLAAAAQKPDVESLGFGDPNLGDARPVALGSADGRAVLNRYRQVVSGAHLSGAREVTNEWGAVLNGQFRLRLEDLRRIADRSLAAGVSRMALHGFAYRLYDGSRPSWPGWCSFCGGALEFSDSWNQSWPQLKALRGLADYLGRAGAALRSGRPAVDLTLMNATSVVNGLLGVAPTAGTPEDRLRRRLAGAGYSWDVIDPVSREALGRGRAYRALVVDDQAALPAAAAKRLVRLARSGLPVVLYGKVPRAGVGFKGASGEDAAVRSAIRRLRRLPNVRLARTPIALLARLRALSVGPAFAPRERTGIVPVHRRTAAGDLWFLFNDSGRPARGRFRFATPGAPAQIDLWTGRTTRLAEYTRRGRHVTLPLALGPGETALLAFDRRRARGVSVAATTADSARVAGGRLVLRDHRGGGRTVRLSDGRRLRVTLPAVPRPRRVVGPWRLAARTTAPSGDASIGRTLQALAPWEAIPQLRGKSGTGTYTTTVRVPRRWLAARRGVLLDPGAFGGALRVWVNGRRAATPALAGEAPRDVTTLLRAGGNALRLEVSTSLNNAIVSQGATGDPDYAKYASRPLERSGLVGPVRLVPYAEAPVLR